MLLTLLLVGGGALLWRVAQDIRRLRALARRAQGTDDVALLGMTTKGDQILDRTLSKVGGKGLFVKELEVALEAGRADLAVPPRRQGFRAGHRVHGPVHVLRPGHHGAVRRYRLVGDGVQSHLRAHGRGGRGLRGHPAGVPAESERARPGDGDEARAGRVRPPGEVGPATMMEVSA